MGTYIEAVKRPFTSFSKLIIGILLSIVPIINFFAGGYLLECARSAKKKSSALPEWKNFGDLFIQGFFVFLISIIYMIPMIIYSIFAFGTALLGQMVAFNPDLSLLESAGMGPIVIGIIIFALSIYVIPSAILSYAFSRKLSSGFEFKNVFKKAFTYNYFTPWLSGGITYFVLIIILGGIPIVGAAIGSFIGGIIFYTLLGESWS